MIRLAFALAFLLCLPALSADEMRDRSFDPTTDLLLLHYDHAPDKDDGHSAAADRTILETAFGSEWIKEHVLAVSGTYGKNAKTFNAKSDHVMDVTWNECGGWLAAHDDHDKVVETLVERWSVVLKNGGDIWIKEGGQSDITTKVVKILHRKMPEIETVSRIHVVQHSKWNEDHTTDEALAFTKDHTHYIKIQDANKYLNLKGGDEAFENAATRHPTFGESWKAAFQYYNPKHRLDFSDTGELMYILGLGEIGIDNFCEQYLLTEGR